MSEIFRSLVLIIRISCKLLHSLHSQKDWRQPEIYLQSYKRYNFRETYKTKKEIHRIRKDKKHHYLIVVWKQLLDVTYRNSWFSVQYLNTVHNYFVRSVNYVYYLYQKDIGIAEKFFQLLQQITTVTSKIHS